MSFIDESLDKSQSSWSRQVEQWAWLQV